MDLFIHIGYPKTGTTTLQKALFSNHSELFYLNNYISSELMKNLLWGRVSNIERIRKTVQKDISSFDYSNSKAAILSSESFTSVGMYFGTVKRRYSTTFLIYPDISVIAEKLRIIFKNNLLFNKVYIFATIRNQLDFLKSYYAQEYNRFFSVNKETKNFNKFIKYILQNKDTFILDNLDYYEQFKHFERNFGVDYTKVFVFEKFKSNPNEYLKELAEFIGIDSAETLSLCLNQYYNKKNTKNGYKTEKTNLTKYLIHIKKIIGLNNATGFTNTSIYNSLKKIEFGGKFLKEFEINNEDIASFYDFFAESNSKLNKKHMLGLEGYNYFLK